LQITKLQNHKSVRDISFKRGLSSGIARQIQKADVVEISAQIRKMNIDCDFKGNKIIAWSCAKILEIIKKLNEVFDQPFASPKGIFVENFNELKIGIYSNPPERIYGLCNLIPTKLLKNSDKIIPSRTLFFNQNYSWEDIDSLSDISFGSKEASTDFFLHAFLHDFSHCAHEDRILKRHGAKRTREILDLITSDDFLQKYRQNFAKELSSISQYALENPLEAVAEDTSRLICNSLNKELILTKNPFADSPYAGFLDYHKHFGKHSSKDKLLRAFWNGFV